MAAPPNVPPDVAPSGEDRFRSALQDAAVILRKLAPLCKDVNEMVEMLELAAANEGQLTLLMDRIGPVRLR